MNVLTLCGSLRVQSSNRAMLRAFARLAPAGVTVVHYERLGALPHFSPDDDAEPLPAEVVALRAAIAAADAIAISTPEYAHGLPGSFKNALDWLVSDPAFAGKAVVLIAADRGSTWAADSLREILRTMSARVIEPACAALPLGTNRVDDDAILGRAELRAQLAACWAALGRARQICQS